MTRDEIYDHLAQVYLGKTKAVDEKKKKKQANVWLVVNLATTVVIFLSAFYGLTAFLSHRTDDVQNSVIYSLHRGPVRLSFDFKDEYPPVKTLLLSLPEMDASKYKFVSFSIRSKEEGSPKILKVEVKNFRNEKSFIYIRGIDGDWENYKISLADFKEISDWSSVTQISFVLEEWNVDQKSGLILIDELSFISG